ncbi:hypothetical protein HZS_4700 [Henneguya salminicola]|nr:hypothetical protein HZS_4700 [Henneguya salminicola]
MMRQQKFNNKDMLYKENVEKNEKKLEANIKKFREPYMSYHKGKLINKKYENDNRNITDINWPHNIMAAKQKLTKKIKENIFSLKKNESSCQIANSKQKNINNYQFYIVHQRVCDVGHILSGTGCSGNFLIYGTTNGLYCWKESTIKCKIYIFFFNDIFCTILTISWCVSDWCNFS